MTRIPAGRLAPAPLLVVAAAILWGTTGTAQALGPPGAAPSAVGAVRILVGGAALLAVAAARGGLAAGRPWPPLATGAAAVSMAAYQPLFFTAVRSTGVAVGTVVAIGSAPILAGLLAYLVRGERPGRRWGVATTLAVGGAGVLLLGPGGGRADPHGVLLALGAGLCYAVYATAGKQLLDRRPPTAVMAMAFGIGALLLLPVLAVSDLAPLLTGPGLLMALHLGLVATAAAYVLFARGLVGVPVATAATLSLAEPLTAGLLGILLLREPLTPSSGLGMLLVMAGLALLTLGTRRRRADHTEGRPDRMGGP